MGDNLSPIFHNPLHFESQFQMALESQAEGVAICIPIHNDSGRIADFTYLYVNKALAAMTKLRQEDMVGKRMSGVIPGFLQSQLFSFCRETIEFKEQRTIKSEYFREEINSRVLEGYYDSTITYFENGVVITIHDVTDSKLKELELKKAADLLIKSEEDFRLLFENSFDALFLTEPNGRIDMCNRAAEKLLGYSADEICRIGRDGIADLTDQNWQRALSEREITGKFVGQLRYRRKDGTVFTGECSSILFKTSDGSIRTSIVMRDITDRLKSEQMLKKTSRQLQEIIDGSSSIVFAKDLEGRFILINHEMEELLCISSEEIKGKTDFDILPKDMAEYFRGQDLKVLSKGKAIQFEEDVDIFGKNKYLLTNKFPLFDESGKPYAICGIGIDVSELKKKDEKLKRTVEALKRSNQELEQFAYCASHDLQEPLRMIANYAKILEGKYKDKLDDKAKEYIKYMVNGVKRMNGLIQDLLSYARLTSKVQPFGECDLNSVVEEVLQDLQVAILESGAEIKYDRLPVICADYSQIKQLFQNLITNAIKFRGSNIPQITIDAEYKGQEWILSVKDNGIGIKSKHFERIFLLLQRLHTSEEYPGTGMGLAICKKIVERHEGRIWVESEEGKGSTFHCTLPGLAKN